MRRVVVTGMGIVSCIGNELDEVAGALRSGRCGIRYVDEYARLGLRSCVAGVPSLSREPPVDRKIRRYMGDASLYAYHAMSKAIADASLTAREVSSPRVGLVVGSGVGSTLQHHEAVEVLKTRGIGKVPPFTVPRVMGSTTSACLTAAFGIQGRSYSMTAACATSTHSIGHAKELIGSGKQDMVFAGGSEEVAWTSTAMFDAMGVLSTGFNDRPKESSRPFDTARDGFVMAGGGGILVLEEFECARARGARIYAELAGYGASSDGCEMVTANAAGAARAMRDALDDGGMDRVDYVSAHATSTPQGDVAELAAIGRAFPDSGPMISSIKGLTGHAIGAAGVHGAICGLLMMERGFVAGCANLTTPDAGASGMHLVRTCLERPIESFLSNSFGFGGTNASLLFRRCH